MNSFEFIHRLWQPETELLILAASLGAIIGLEREMAGKDPSLRTFSLISLGACLFTLLSLTASAGIPHADPGRIAAQIVTGIGFLGAGTIFRSRRGVSGLTTAALMWVTAGLGTAVGYGRVDIALSGTIVAVLVTASLTLLHRLLKGARGHTDRVEDTK